jgi:hypothetical protein
MGERFVTANAPIFFLDRFKCVIKMTLPTLKVDNVGKLVFGMIGAVYIKL